MTVRWIVVERPQFDLKRMEFFHGKKGYDVKIDTIATFNTEEEATLAADVSAEDTVKE